VIVRATGALPSTLTIDVSGGNGGTQLITNDESEGPGGGGSGGFVATTGGTPTIKVVGGANGTTTSAAITEFTANGATMGASGHAESAPAPTIPTSCTSVGVSLDNLTDGRTTATPGTQTTYTFTVTNGGTSPVPGAQVTDNAPLLNNVSWTCAGSGCPAPSGTGPLDVTVTLPAGGTLSFSVTGTIDSGATGRW
jgi:uncharacterized repeat protein (TIGR01451 family)